MILLKLQQTKSFLTADGKVKPINQVLQQHKSIYAAGKHHEVKATQLHRLADAGALVDETGQVWIKSKTALKV